MDCRFATFHPAPRASRRGPFPVQTGFAGYVKEQHFKSQSLRPLGGGLFLLGKQQKESGRAGGRQARRAGASESTRMRGLGCPPLRPSGSDPGTRLVRPPPQTSLSYPPNKTYLGYYVNNKNVCVY
jgi:hypothetical protein